jgi:general L-amino acid transport system substrate-binding protein
MDAVKRATLLMAMLFAVPDGAQSQTPGQTLAKVRARGSLLCGIDRSEAEYSSTDEHGNRAAFDRDLCNAVAVAAMGTNARIVVTYYADDITSMQALADGKADMIASLTPTAKPINVEGQALPIAFTQPVLNDATGIMVLGSSGITTAAQLSGRKICYLTETATEAHLQAWFAEHRLDLLPFPFQEEGEMEAAYVTDNCVGLAGDLTRLAQTRASTGERADAYAMLQQTFGGDTLAMAYRSDDAAWGELLSATRDVLLSAESLGITQANALAATSTTTATQAWLLTTNSVGERAALSRGWASQVIAAVGNYGELFDRDAGAKALLRLDDAPVRVGRHQTDH